MTVCSIDGCNEKHYGHGLCVAHYRRERAAGGLEFYDESFPAIDFCRCLDPTPEPVKLWGHVVIPDAFQCAECGRGFEPDKAA